MTVCLHHGETVKKERRMAGILAC
uniref:Uncharacterized protein n=1 Tax=Anguilla anguilla TaxID=7936 RepID=A0A0E9SH56_ANGAN